MDHTHFRTPPAQAGGSLLAVSLVIAAGAALLTTPALLNGFPFVLDDTMDYLVFTPRLYRSPFYGVFAYAFHLNHFIWLPILAQAAIASHLVWTWTRILLPERPLPAFAALLLLLTLFSSLPIVCSYLMPDIFASAMVLSMGLLAFHHARLSRLETGYFFLLACLSVSAHLSHLAIAIPLLAVIGAIVLIQRRGISCLLVPAALTASAVLLPATAILLNNITVHRIFALSPAGPVFMLANLVERGPALSYLRQACPSAGYRICAELPRLPHDSNAFLWGATLKRLGGFSGMREEASRIVWATILSRPGEIAKMSIEATGDAFFARAPAEGLGTQGAENKASLAKLIETKFGADEATRFRTSAQSRNDLPWTLLRSIDAVVFPVSLCLVLAGLLTAWWFRLPDIVSFSALILAGVAINMVVCSTTSGVFDRYQARVSWLLPFAMILIALHLRRRFTAGAMTAARSSQ